MPPAACLSIHILLPQRHRRPASSAHFETLSDRLKFVRFLTFQLRTDFFKLLHDIRRVKMFAATKAYCRWNRDGRGVSATTKQFLHLFRDNFSTTNGTFLERHHCFGFLNRQLIHRCGSGRYTVINSLDEGWVRVSGLPLPTGYSTPKAQFPRLY